MTAGLFAATITAAIGGALLSSFYIASPSVWLTPTPEIMTQVGRCEQLAGRHEQTSCKQRVVTAQLSKPAPALQVAGR